MLNRLAFALGLIVASSLQAQQSGLDLKAIDKSVNPCDDFYQYACGNWVKTHPIPPDQATYSTFDQIHDRNQEILRGILQDAAAHQSRSVTDQKIGAFYESCMNEAEINQRGLKPAQPEIDRISHLNSTEDLVAEAARLHQRQVAIFFDFDSTPNPKDTRSMIADVSQGGLGLPEPGYFTRTDDKSVAIRDKYLAHIQRMFELAGIPKSESAERAKQVLRIETELAKSSLEPTAERDPKNVIHVLTVADLNKLAPHFNWTEFFKQVGTPAFTTINIGEPDFFKKFDQLVATEHMDNLRDYILWHYLHGSATVLDKPFQDENFAFYGAVLSGTKQQRPRWKRCVSATDSELGDALGRVFVDKAFGQEGKDRMLEMVHGIESEMQQDIDSLSWMTPQTKQQALVKLHGILNKIGYPEKWRDYSTVVVTDADYFGNWYRANEYESKRNRDKIGQPADKQEWNFTTPTVNAGYNPLQNTINFPAGILQPPFFSNKASDAVNYGGIGMVIGHELTHAFDDEGRQFDENGNLRDWWQKSDEGKFNDKAKCLSQEASQYEALPGLKVNGELTLGENTADQGGLRLAYMALMDLLKEKGVPLDARIDGYTPAQQFFLGEAQDWCNNIRPEQARMYIQADPHPPSKFRVNGVVSNMEEFQKAFGCKVGDKMYRTEACRVW